VICVCTGIENETKSFYFGLVWRSPEQQHFFFSTMENEVYQAAIRSFATYVFYIPSQDQSE
jgi:hypothetical protein